MRRNRFVPILATAAFAGALVTGGCISAAAGPSPAAATASARAAAATGGKANIVIYGVNTDGAYWHAIVSGVIGDYGPAVSIYPNGNIDPAHDSEMELRLTHGSFQLSIAALDKAFIKAGSRAPIVAGSGTGAYRGIRGAFPVTLTLNEVEAGPCQPSPGAFRAQLITLSGSGTVSF